MQPVEQTCSFQGRRRAAEGTLRRGRAENSSSKLTAAAAVLAIGKRSRLTPNKLIRQSKLSCFAGLSPHGTLEEAETCGRASWLSLSSCDRAPKLRSQPLTPASLGLTGIPCWQGTFNSLRANSHRFVNHYLKVSVQPGSHSLLSVFQNNPGQKNLSGRAQAKVSFTFPLREAGKETLSKSFETWSRCQKESQMLRLISFAVNLEI